MAKKDESEKIDDSTAPSNVDVAGALARFIQSQDDGPIRQVSVHKAKYRTAFNPSGGPVPKLKRKFRMNGAQLRDRMLTPKEIDLLNELKTGKYHNNRWFVTQTDGEGDQDGATVYIYVPNKTQADRLELAQTAPSLEVLLRLMVDEGKARAA